MRKLSLILGAVALVAATRESEAQSLSVSGSPSTMRIQTAVAGSTPTAVTNAATTYTINSGSTANMKVVGRLNSSLPSGVTLTVTLQAPSGGISQGAVSLSTTSQDLVTSIDKNTNSTRSITYQLSATLSAGVVAAQSRTVTLTVIQGT